MPTDHIVRSYDNELSKLASIISQMGGLAETQLANAIQALIRRDTELATAVISADAQVDQLERDVDQLVVRVLALRQPVASDLRDVIVALRISADIERIADYAKNVAKRAIATSSAPPLRATASVPRMGNMVLAMIKDVLDAYISRDAEKARAVWERDGEVDEMYNSIFRELLTYMMEDPRAISACTHLLFIAKNIERIGDHATNVAELVYYAVIGQPLAETRPKGDTTSFAMVTPDGKDRAS